MRRALHVVLFALAGWSATEAATPGFLRSQQLRVDAVKAEEKGDLNGAYAALKEALELRPLHPGILLSLASVEARLGMLDEGALHVFQFASMGLVAELKKNPDFQALKYRPHYVGALVTMEKNALPIGSPEPTYRLGDGRALFEGIAIDPATDRVFAGSVRESRIVVIEKGVSRDFVKPDAGLWSVYGLAIDSERGLLWAVSAAGDQTQGVPEAEGGASGLFAFDLASGELKRKAVLPPESKSALGDLTIARDGTVYATDSANPQIYRLKPDAKEIEPFAGDRRFVSLQGVTLSSDESRMLVADYALGLFAVDMKTLRATSISPTPLTTFVGIDGLTGHGPFIATQNGVNPQRVLKIALDEDWLLATDTTVLAANSPLHDEITLGQIVGDAFVYIANSQWNRFNPDGTVLGDKPFAETIAATIPLQ